MPLPLFIVDLLRQPLYQFLLCLFVTILLLPFLRKRSPDAIWSAAGTCYIGFIFINAVGFLFEDHLWRYFFTSMGFSLLHILISGILVSALIGVLKQKGSGESAMIFLTVIYHPAILLFIMLIKWIIGLLG